MMTRFSLGQRQLAAVGMLTLVIASLVIAAVTPVWWLHQRYDGKIEEYLDQLKRFQRVAALRPAIEMHVLELEKLDGAQYYLKGHAPALIGAELQGLLTRIVESHQGRVVSSQLQPAKDERKPNDPVKTLVSVQFMAATVPLQLILHQIEAHKPYLFVEQVTARAPLGRAYKPTPGVQPEFTVQILVSGYSLADAGRQ
jgi:hypothetical protein